MARCTPSLPDIGQFEEYNGHFHPDIGQFVNFVTLRPPKKSPLPVGYVWEAGFFGIN
jgi:hypothetical protein